MWGDAAGEWFVPCCEMWVRIVAQGRRFECVPRFPRELAWYQGQMTVRSEESLGWMVSPGA